MEKIQISGIEFTSFGANNYSDGMELVTCSNPPKDLVDRVKQNKIHNGEKFIFLNPSAQGNDFEFYGVYGTKEQYKKLYKHQRESQLAKKMVEKFGWGNWPKELAEQYRAQLEKEYKDWWE